MAKSMGRQVKVLTFKGWVDAEIDKNLLIFKDTKQIVNLDECNELSKPIYYDTEYYHLLESADRLN